MAKKQTDRRLRNAMNSKFPSVNKAEMNRHGESTTQAYRNLSTMRDFNKTARNTSMMTAFSPKNLYKNNAARTNLRNN